MLLSTAVFFVSTAKISQISEESNDILYHLTCNYSSIKYVVYYPIRNGRVTDDLIFNPFRLIPEQLTQTAVEYMTPMCTRLAGTSSDGVNHEWFISSENFSRPIPQVNTSSFFIQVPFSFNLLGYDYC